MAFWRLILLLLLSAGTAAWADDPPMHVLPESQPATRPLRVLTPGSLPWRLAGRVAWQASGDTISVTPGEYLVECQPPFPTEPAPPAVRILIAPGNTLETRSIDALPPQGADGSLVVIIEPAEVASSSVPRDVRGQWRFAGETGETQWRNGGLAGVPLAPGAYTIEFRPVEGKVGVGTRSVVIQPGKPSQVRVYYEDESALLPGAAQPEPVPANEVETSPYCFAGQLQTDAGSGSGTVVKPRVVLTAAHVVFDDVTLTYTTGVKWLFQRQRGTVEPAALVPRGTYVFSSYAQVRLDSRVQLGVGQATQVSQQRDAAAIYFTQEAGRFGYTDVLSTDDTSEHEWLANLDPGTSQPRLKTLISYPVSLNFLKPANGYSELDAGKMFRTPPTAALFTKVTAEALPAGITEQDARLGTNRVYQTTALAGYPGSSGGCLWVQYDDGQYYPAGIYVGGTDRSVVRAIDGAVVDLISRADASAQSTSDQNNTSGGIARVLSVTTNSSYTSAKLQVIFTGLAPADQAKASWMAGNSPTRYFGADTKFVLAGSYLLRFARVAGYREPQPLQITVRNTDDVVVQAQYVQNRAPTIVTPALGRAESGRPYSFPLRAAGAPTAYEVVSSEVTGLQVSSRGLLTLANVTQPPGIYRVAVKASNANGSMTRLFSLQVVTTGHLEVRHRDVTDPFNVRQLSSPIDGAFDNRAVDDLVTLDAGAQRGLVFKQWTGFGIENLPTTSRRLSFTMKPQVILFAEFVKSPFPARVGSYFGLAQDEPARLESSGLCQVTLLGTGAFTGRLFLATETLAFRGSFRIDGTFRGEVQRPRRSRTDPARSPLDLELALEIGSSGNDVIRGTIAGAFASGTSARSAISFAARRAATPGGANRVYTLAVPRDTTTPANDLTKPQGASVASLTVTTAGRVTGTLLLADGASTPVAGTLSRSDVGAAGAYAVSLFAPLYRGHGSFSATVVLNHTTNVLSGSSRWFRDSFALQAPLTGSWPDGLTSTVRGQLFPRPSTTVPIFAGFQPGPLLQSDDVEFRFDTAGNRVFTGIMTATGAFFENPGQNFGYTVKINPLTGLVVGSFQPGVPGSNPPAFGTVQKFTGAILRSENQALGAVLSQDQAAEPGNDTLVLRLVP